MFRSVRVGSIVGIPIRLDITFLLILPIFAWLIGLQITDLIAVLNQVFGAEIDPEPLTVDSRPWILGLAAAIGLFIGVILHELGHSVVAIRYGYPIGSITLWLLGGVAQLERQPRDWRHELWIAIAGPIVSVLLGIGCYIAMLGLPPTLDALRFLFGYLALMNVVLAMFNLLPGFPMDGGRVLRALLARRRPFVTATRQAAEIGRLFAIGLGLLGLLTLNLLLIAVAFFIYIAAASEARQVVVESAFEGVTARDVMTAGEEVTTVVPSESVDELLSIMFRHRHTGYPVLDGDDLVGVVTFDDVRSVPAERRTSTTVREIMSTDLTTIRPDLQAVEALSIMQGADVGRLLVTDRDGRLVGLLTRTDLMRAFAILQETDRYSPAGDGRVVTSPGGTERSR